ncbi:hypothetical protein BDV98DRAFT_596600 [Pterulicium gracile]|uniref:Uncharacterized protein n=1 Tax=Pterulicium gracile TaxID=1884261 RepID=A0A5C3QB55_9AGAR|nr:hypothetical protein BDV98DRAFT_596600 [Pterula gracilis]
MSEPTEHDYITAESTATQEIIAEYADDLESLDAETAAELVNRFRNVGEQVRSRRAARNDENEEYDENPDDDEIEDPSGHIKKDKDSRRKDARAIAEESDDDGPEVVNNSIPSAINKPASTSRLSDAVLAKAPHLAMLEDVVDEDPYLQKTINLGILFASEKDIITLPESLWKDVILDQFVNFEKVLAALDGNYDYQDAGKDFGGGFVLIKKD